MVTQRTLLELRMWSVRKVLLVFLMDLKRGVLSERLCLRLLSWLRSPELSPLQLAFGYFTPTLVELRGAGKPSRHEFIPPITSLGWILLVPGVLSWLPTTTVEGAETRQRR